MFWPTKHMQAFILVMKTIPPTFKVMSKMK